MGEYKQVGMLLLQPTVGQPLRVSVACKCGKCGGVLGFAGDPPPSLASPDLASINIKGGLET